MLSERNNGSPEVQVFRLRERAGNGPTRAACDLITRWCLSRDKLRVERVECLHEDSLVMLADEVKAESRTETEIRSEEL